MTEAPTPSRASPETGSCKQWRHPPSTDRPRDYPACIAQFSPGRPRNRGGVYCRDLLVCFDRAAWEPTLGVVGLAGGPDASASEATLGSRSWWLSQAEHRVAGGLRDEAVHGITPLRIEEGSGNTGLREILPKYRPRFARLHLLGRESVDLTATGQRELARSSHVVNPADFAIGRHHIAVTADLDRNHRRRAVQTTAGACSCQQRRRCRSESASSQGGHQSVHRASRRPEPILTSHGGQRTFALGTATPASVPPPNGWSLSLSTSPMSAVRPLLATYSTSTRSIRCPIRGRTQTIFHVAGLGQPESKVPRSLVTNPADRTSPNQGRRPREGTVLRTVVPRPISPSERVLPPEARRLVSAGRWPARRR